MAGRNAGSVTKAVDRICRVAMNRNPLFALPACSTPNWLYGTKKRRPKRNAFDSICFDYFTSLRTMSKINSELGGIDGRPASP